MDIVEKLMKERDKRGWSNYKLAKESNLPTATVSHMFKRKAAPQIATLESLCKGLGITLSEFFAENETCRHLTDAQIEMIDLWNCLSDEKRDAIKTFLILLNVDDKS